MAQPAPTVRPLELNKYDAVLRVDLFTDVYDWNRGWKMAVNPASVAELDNCAAVRVAPIGVFNAGKTWLIKQLCGDGAAGLVSATDAHTEGLSIKISNLQRDARKACFLDTAGLNSPVTSVTALGRMLGTSKMEPMKAMDEMLQELKRQENFIRQVAFEFAQVYLLVVGQISHRDQLELLQLIQLAEQHGGKKDVVVVHNLKNMWYHDFAVTKDPNTQLTYLESMQKVFKLTASQVEVGPQHPERSVIELLTGSFGRVDAAVKIRHVFITRQGTATTPDHLCRNHLVIEYLRTMIQSVSPHHGNVIGDLAKIANTVAKNMVRLPPNRDIEIRYHAERCIMVGGLVHPDDRARLIAAAKVTPTTAALDAAKAECERCKLECDEDPLNETKRLAFEQADVLLSDEMVKATARPLPPRLDAKDLDPLMLARDGAVNCRPVALGATAATNGDGHAKFNVSRARIFASGQPYWMVLVHITLPGLAAGELVKLRKKLIWNDEEEGLRNEPITPQSAETLKIRFKARVLPFAVRQIAALNQYGTPQQGKTLGGAIRVDGTTAPVVIEAGNRPFPTAEGTTQQAREALREDGSYELDVLVHTKVENCSWEVVPVLNYSRGILTVCVCAEPSDEDRNAPSNLDWANNTDASVFPDLPEWVPHSNGTDDDLQE